MDKSKELNRLANKIERIKNTDSYKKIRETLDTFMDYQHIEFGKIRVEDSHLIGIYEQPYWVQLDKWERTIKKDKQLGIKISEKVYQHIEELKTLVEQENKDLDAGIEDKSAYLDKKYVILDKTDLDYIIEYLYAQEFCEDNFVLYEIPLYDDEVVIMLFYDFENDRAFTLDYNRKDNTVTPFYEYWKKGVGNYEEKAESLKEAIEKGILFFSEAYEMLEWAEKQTDCPDKITRKEYMNIQKNYYQ